MSDPQAILRNTSRITAVGLAVAWLLSGSLGQAAVVGFSVGAAIILVNLFVLAFTVDKINLVLVHGGSLGMATVALHGRFFITVLSVLTAATLTSLPAVVAGALFVFTTLILVAYSAASSMELAAPLESL